MDINSLIDDQIKKVNKEIERKVDELKTYIFCPACGYEITVTLKTKSTSG